MKATVGICGLLIALITPVFGDSLASANDTARIHLASTLLCPAPMQEVIFHDGQNVRDKTLHSDLNLAVSRFLDSSTFCKNLQIKIYSNVDQTNPSPYPASKLYADIASSAFQKQGIPENQISILHTGATQTWNGNSIEGFNTSNNYIAILLLGTEPDS